MAEEQRKKRTITEIRESKTTGEKMVYTSVPDYTSARWAEMAGVDVAVVDDSSSPDFETALATADALIVRSATKVRAEMLEGAPELTVIGRAGVGVDNIDLDAAGEAGIVVSNARNYATASVVEHVFLLMLALIRRLEAYRERVTAGDWTRSRYFCLFDAPIEELSGKTLGIIGFGVLGQAVAQLARAFSMQVKVAQHKM